MRYAKPQAGSPRLRAKVKARKVMVYRVGVREFVVDAGRAGATSLDVADHFGIKRSAVNQHLLRLVRAGEILRRPMFTGQGGRPEYLYTARIT